MLFGEACRSLRSSSESFDQETKAFLVANMKALEHVSDPFPYSEGKDPKIAEDVRLAAEACGVSEKYANTVKQSVQTSSASEIIDALFSEKAAVAETIHVLICIISESVVMYESLGPVLAKAGSISASVHLPDTLLDALAKSMSSPLPSKVYKWLTKEPGAFSSWVLGRLKLQAAWVDVMVIIWYGESPRVHSVLKLLDLLKENVWGQTQRAEGLLPIDAPSAEPIMHLRNALGDRLTLLALEGIHVEESMLIDSTDVPEAAKGSIRDPQVLTDLESRIRTLAALDPARAQPLLLSLAYVFSKNGLEHVSLLELSLTRGLFQCLRSFARSQLASSVSSLVPQYRYCLFNVVRNVVACVGSVIRISYLNNEAYAALLDTIVLLAGDSMANEVRSDVWRMLLQEPDVSSANLQDPGGQLFVDLVAVVYEQELVKFPQDFSFVRLVESLVDDNVALAAIDFLSSLPSFTTEWPYELHRDDDDDEGELAEQNTVSVDPETLVSMHPFLKPDVDLLVAQLQPAPSNDVQFNAFSERHPLEPFSQPAPLLDGVRLSRSLVSVQIPWSLFRCLRYVLVGFAKDVDYARIIATFPTAFQDRLGMVASLLAKLTGSASVHPDIIADVIFASESETTAVASATAGWLSAGLTVDQKHTQHLVPALCKLLASMASRGWLSTVMHSMALFINASGLFSAPVLFWERKSGSVNIIRGLVSLLDALVLSDSVTDDLDADDVRIAFYSSVVPTVLNQLWPSLSNARLSNQDLYFSLASDVLQLVSHLFSATDVSPQSHPSMYELHRGIAASLCFAPDIFHLAFSRNTSLAFPRFQVSSIQLLYDFAIESLGVSPARKHDEPTPGVTSTQVSQIRDILSTHARDAVALAAAPLSVDANTAVVSVRLLPVIELFAPGHFSPKELASLAKTTFVDEVSMHAWAALATLADTRLSTPDLVVSNLVRVSYDGKPRRVAFDSVIYERDQFGKDETAKLDAAAKAKENPGTSHHQEDSASSKTALAEAVAYLENHSVDTEQPSLPALLDFVLAVWRRHKPVLPRIIDSFADNERLWSKVFVLAFEHKQLRVKSRALALLGAHISAAPHLPAFFVSLLDKYTSDLAFVYDAFSVFEPSIDPYDILCLTASLNQNTPSRFVNAALWSTVLVDYANGLRAFAHAFPKASSKAAAVSRRFEDTLAVHILAFVTHLDSFSRALADSDTQQYAPSVMQALLDLTLVLMMRAGKGSAPDGSTDRSNQAPGDSEPTVSVLTPISRIAHVMLHSPLLVPVTKTPSFLSLILLALDRPLAIKSLAADAVAAADLVHVMVPFIVQSFIDTEGESHMKSALSSSLGPPTSLAALVLSLLIRSDRGVHPQAVISRLLFSDFMGVVSYVLLSPDSGNSSRDTHLLNFLVALAQGHPDFARFLIENRMVPILLETPVSKIFSKSLILRSSLRLLAALTTAVPPASAGSFVTHSLAALLARWSDRLEQPIAKLSLLVTNPSRSTNVFLHASDLFEIHALASLLAAAHTSIPSTPEVENSSIDSQSLPFVSVLSRLCDNLSYAISHPHQLQSWLAPGDYAVLAADKDNVSHALSDCVARTLFLLYSSLVHSTRASQILTLSPMEWPSPQALFLDFFSFTYRKLNQSASITAPDSFALVPYQSLLSVAACVIEAQSSSSPVNYPIRTSPASLDILSTEGLTPLDSSEHDVLWSSLAELTFVLASSQLILFLRYAPHSSHSLVDALSDLTRNVASWEGLDPSKPTLAGAVRSALARQGYWRTR